MCTVPGWLRVCNIFPIGERNDTWIEWLGIAFTIVSMLIISSIGTYFTYARFDDAWTTWNNISSWYAAITAVCLIILVSVRLISKLVSMWSDLNGLGRTCIVITSIIVVAVMGLAIAAVCVLAIRRNDPTTYDNRLDALNNTIISCEVQLKAMNGNISSYEAQLKALNDTVNNYGAQLNNLRCILATRRQHPARHDQCMACSITNVCIYTAASLLRRVFNT
jgi:Co/Zn/Cd efflux system component